LRGKARASFLLAVDDIRRRGCAAAGVRLAGKELSAICRLDLYGAWRLLTVFDAPERCILLLVAEHTRTANPYQLLYDALGIGEPEEPRTKPSCCDSDGDPPSTLTLPSVSNRASAGSPRQEALHAAAAAASTDEWCYELKLRDPTSGCAA
jgi:hypothetical protein